MSALAEISHVAGAAARVAARHRTQPTRYLHTKPDGTIAIFDFYTLAQAEEVRESAMAGEERAPVVSWLVASAATMLTALAVQRGGGHGVGAGLG